MSHRKEISLVHLITCYKAQEKSKFYPLKATDGLQNRLFCWFVKVNCALVPSDKKNAESKGVLLNLPCKFEYNLILKNAEPKYTKDK